MNKKITPFHLFLLLFLFFSIPAFSGLSHNDTISPAASDSGHSIVSGIPVRPFGTTLFDFYTNVGPFSAETRVQELEKKMIKLAESPFFIADSLKIVHQGDFIHIMFGSEFLTVITRGDSVAENLSRETIAKTRFDKILFSIRDFRESHSKENAIKGILFSVITLFFLIVLVVLVNRLFRFFEQKIRIWQGTGRSVIRVLNYDLLNKNTQVLILLFLNKVFRIFTYFLSLILGLLLMFYLLPWTKNYSLEFLNFMLSPLKTLLGGFLNFLPNILIIFIILVVARFINRFFRFLKKEIEGEALKIPGFYPEYALPTFNIIRVIVWIFTVIIIWPYIPGSDSKIFQGMSVFIGLVFSLTSASLVSNLMAGFSLTYTRAFRIGDRIKIGEITGDVVEKSMLVTKLRTIKNEEITIPNSKIMNSEVVNYSEEAPKSGLILYTSVTIGYDSPWRKIHELLIDAALSTPGILQDPLPFVLQTSLDDFYISYQINGYTRNASRMAEIYSDLHKAIQDKFNEAGMEIMSPHYKSLRDGNTIAIPEEYRDKDYKNPAFRVEKP